MSKKYYPLRRSGTEIPRLFEDPFRWLVPHCGYCLAIRIIGAILALVALLAWTAWPWFGAVPAALGTYVVLSFIGNMLPELIDCGSCSSICGR